MSIIPKKRGRKPFKKYEIVDETLPEKEIVVMNSNNDPHLILHLHMHTNGEKSNNCVFPKESFETSFLEYDPDMNEPIAYEDINIKSSIPEECDYKEKNNEPNSIKDIFNQQSQSKENFKEKEIVISNHSKLNNILLKDLINPSNWSNPTEYWCQWDCHPFENNPIGLPVKFKNNKFLIVGCFCSLECATAYNFHGNDTTYNSWENYNLINMLSNSLNYKSQVNPALSRKCLNVFGGNLDIGTFRSNSKANKQLNILQYPMVPLVEHVEEINETIPYHQNMAYIPLDKVRVDKIEEANKDRVHGKKKSNLEEKMSLKFTH